MNEYTPETLEAFADASPGSFARLTWRDYLRLHAAAWKADIEQLDKAVAWFEGDDSPRARLEVDRDALREALAADLAYHSNNTGLNMEWRKAALARLPKGWAEREWPLLDALCLASLPPDRAHDEWGNNVGDVAPEESET